jgi:hypothetical protein
MTAPDGFDDLAAEAAQARAEARAADIEELRHDVKAARLAAYGDSNDAEIELLQAALDGALSLLGVDEIELTDAEIDKAENPA